MAQLLFLVRASRDPIEGADCHIPTPYKAPLPPIHHSSSRRQEDKMIAYAKLAVLLMMAIIAMALSAEARSLLNAWGNCYNSACSFPIVLESTRS